MLFPAVTSVGLPESVTRRSATPPAATAMLTAAELFVAPESCEVVVTVSVSLMMVPEAVPLGTW